MPGATPENRLLDLLAYSIIDVPMVQRRTEVARRVGHVLAGYLRDQMIPMQVGSSDSITTITEPMIPLSKISNLLRLLDGVE